MESRKVHVGDERVRQHLRKQRKAAREHLPASEVLGGFARDVGEGLLAEARGEVARRELRAKHEAKLARRAERARLASGAKE